MKNNTAMTAMIENTLYMSKESLLDFFVKHNMNVDQVDAYWDAVNDMLNQADRENDHNLIDALVKQQDKCAWCLLRIEDYIC